MARMRSRPASRARASISRRSESNLWPSRWAWESMYTRLFQLRPDRNIFQETCEHRLAVFADRGSDDHAVRFQPAQLARLKVGNDYDLAADQVFRFVSQRDSGDELADFCAYIDFEPQQFVRAFYFFRRLYLTDAQLHFHEVVNGDFSISDCRSLGRRCGLWRWRCICRTVCGLCSRLSRTRAFTCGRGSRRSAG